MTAHDKEARPLRIEFTKMHGLGNDFVVIDDRGAELDLAPEAVEWICDRNFGVGADGLILVREPADREADFAWWFRNADGSVAEMCGNGIRCIAKYVADRGLLPSGCDTVRIETALGVMPIDIARDTAGLVESVTVDMGRPVLRPEDIPSEMRCGANDDRVVDCPLETEAGTFDVTLVSMGNPHCIIWVDDVEDYPVTEMGPLVENHPHFPRKTNVEFAQVIDDSTVRLRVWERGVGETLACGTGACATVVAGVLGLRLGRRATVELPGGELEVRWAEDECVFMTGPATEVFDGTIEIAEDEG